MTSQTETALTGEHGAPTSREDPNASDPLGPGLRGGERKGGDRRLTRLAFGLAAIVLVLDQLTKWWVLEVFRLPEKGSVEVLPIFSLSMVWNRGVSFGLLQAEQDAARWGLAFFSLAVAIALAVWARRVQRPLLAVALGLLIGGAIGNLIDRVRFGAVADFLDFSELYFPWVFNIADSGITIGVCLLILDSLIPARKAAPQ
jgi:signal peptidase II